MTKTYTLALKLWSVHPKDLDVAGYIHKNHGGNYDNPRVAWYADQIQEYVDAAVAAVVEKVVKSIENLQGHHGLNCDGEPYVDYEALQYGDALLSVVIHECVRDLIPTDALAERDAANERNKELALELLAAHTQAQEAIDKLAKAEGLLIDAIVQLEEGKIKTRRNRAVLIRQFLAELTGGKDE